MHLSLSLGNFGKKDCEDSALKMTDDNNLTTPKGISSALEAVQDEAVKLIGILNDLELPQEPQKLLMAKASLIESIARHGVDVRSEEERQA